MKLPFEDQAYSWMERYGLTVLRYSLAIIFIWFGALKPFGLSPASDLVAHTVPFDPVWFIPLLGVWEVIIGVCFLFPRRLLRPGLVLMALQMAGTFLPLILLPDRVYVIFPFALTLEGQYIVKNFVLIGAALTIGGLQVRRTHPP